MVEWPCSRRPSALWVRGGGRMTERVTRRARRWWAGPLAAILLVACLAGLALMVLSALGPGEREAPARAAGTPAPPVGDPPARLRLEPRRLGLTGAGRRRPRPRRGRLRLVPLAARRLAQAAVAEPQAGGPCPRATRHGLRHHHQPAQPHQPLRRRHRLRHLAHRRVAAAPTSPSWSASAWARGSTASTWTGRA